MQASSISPQRDNSSLIGVEDIFRAKLRLRDVAETTPLLRNYRLSEQFGANILLKREDLQVVRSYKIRGAYNKMATLDEQQLASGVVCASAGNHAQGVAFACHQMRVKGRIYMPSVTPRQKIAKVKLFGKEYVEVILVGDTFDDAYAEAKKAEEEQGLAFVHPFNDEHVIAGQGTVGMEIVDECQEDIDYLFVPVGGGGLICGVGSYFRQISPQTRIIGVEPAGAPAMYRSLLTGELVTLDQIDNFVDGAAVRRVGDINLRIAREVIDDMLLVPEGKVCSSILQLYNEEGIVVEPAGALSISALDQYRDEIKGKTVVCIVSGSNNDITRTEEIKERSMLYEGLKHYFIIRFPQRAGALRDFLNNVLGPTDDITYFQYTQKNNRGDGPALVGVQLDKARDYELLLQRMDAHRIKYLHLNDNPMLFELLI